eukprot:CAMPEP_0170170022 /NCGR_PEP_ID=MMETSP0040_2-20121228/2975_1 /TAXON_ID=641309 /ORGANISM="Lotharella oceanica, Strain CCMP622" /LENGTH=113 /DNA_ID=CAMNT_0010409129 /DNA_START=38 /DNA_END=376 /DNA_ORIENTATION=-
MEPTTSRATSYFYHALWRVTEADYASTPILHKWPTSVLRIIFTYEHGEIPEMWEGFEKEGYESPTTEKPPGYLQNKRKTEATHERVLNTVINKCRSAQKKQASSGTTAGWFTW